MTQKTPAYVALTISVERVFNAPREVVYRNWVRAEDLATWFAPDGYSITRSEVDLRVGGRWLVEFTSDTGDAIRESGEFHELVEPERLVFTLTQQDRRGHRGPATMVTVTLVERGSQTVMTFEQTGFSSPVVRDDHARGWEECFRKLDRHVSDSWDAT
jgi:uncharacterized protein YndB with AHSA1/START domain